MEWASCQPDVEIVTMGYHPPWKFRHKHIGWQDLPGYREALHELDIGVAPVVGTPWALCRSDVKALEKTMGGAALVLSDVPPYELWTDGENCLKARDARGFLRAIQSLVQNRDQVKELAEAGSKYVRTERTTQAQVHLWREAIEDDAKAKVA
jgi:glycosyltransferase involved in cell wall biosynthesis